MVERKLLICVLQSRESLSVSVDEEDIDVADSIDSELKSDECVDARSSSLVVDMIADSKFFLYHL
jgi:hypothetical protein